MKKFDLSAIMRKAWKLYRKGVAAFSECLHRAWNSAKAEPINAQRIEEAQQAAGVAEPVNTWAGWKAAGYMVEHGAKALGLSIVKLGQAVEFNSEDNDSVDAIFMFSAPDSNSHIEMISQLAEVLSDDEVMQQIFSTQSAEELQAILLGEASASC